MNQNELTKLIKEVEKNYGKGILLTLNQDESTDPIATLSTGSLVLDRATGIGGYPIGRIIEIFGPESSGKTTLALLAIVSAQKTDKVCAFIDAEHALDINYALKLGVDLNKIIISQPDYGEQALDLVEQLVISDFIDLIIIDSVAALVPKAELDGQVADNFVGLQARMMAKGIRKLVALANRHQTTLIFLNQLREKVGVIFGNPEVTPGGRSLKFAASLRLDVRIKEKLRDNNEYIGQSVKIRVVKNKLAAPYGEAIINFLYASGLDRGEELLELALKKHLVTQSGSWFYYQETKIGHGRKESGRYLLTNNFEEIINKSH